MQRIPTIVQKIADLAKQEDKNTVIDIDLMLDYTRVLYADLLEWRGKLAFTGSLSVNNVNKTQQVAASPVPEPVSKPLILPVEQAGATSPKSDIRHSIGINDKYQFISELFGNNKEAYEETMQQMNSCNTFQQALSWLDEHVYKQYYWNEDSEAVQSFYGILGAFFSER